MEPFFKYHALGNDFVVVDRRATGVDFDAAASRAMCDRHRGIGADGVLAILPAPDATGRMVVHNADGSVAEMCGNGIRCVARYLAEREPTRPQRLTIATGAGPRTCELEWAGDQVARVTVDMGRAEFGPQASQLVQGVNGTVVSMGNPHFVLLNTPGSEAGRLGPVLEKHPSFPMRTNVEFVSVREDKSLQVVVWERGVGLTQACGTGACAAVSVAARQGRVPHDAWVPVELPGGTLEVLAKKSDDRVLMRGAATLVFEGRLPPSP